MAGHIYLIDAEQKLVPMQEAAYESEDLLQKLLAEYPNLLAGDQMNTRAPRRWLFIDREFGVPDDVEVSNRWSLDHLFIDQDAVPTLVEVKRSSDTRLRREVVGQMLDYAANAVSYWSIEQIQAGFERRAEAEGTELQAFLGDHESAAQFWQRVDTNLQAGRIRMVFVADVIPRELKQIIEFLNGQMERAEVLGVEIKQYVNGDLKTLVPTVVGQSAITEARKNTPSHVRQAVTKEELLKLTRDTAGPECARQLSRIIDWAEQRGLATSFTRGNHESSFIPTFHSPVKLAYPISCKHHGQLVLQMRFLKAVPPFDQAHVRKQLQVQLEEIPGFNLRGGMEGLPYVQLGHDQSDMDVERILAILDWIANQLNSGATGAVTPEDH